MLKRLFLFLGILVYAVSVHGQVVYSGFVEKFPIELVTEIYAEGPVTAIYTYTDFDSPIELSGKFEKGSLTLFEKDEKGNNSATLIFDPFDPKSQRASGTWKNLVTNKELKVSLKREFEVGVDPDKSSLGVELRQAASMKSGYFKLVITQAVGYPRVTGVKLYEKKTDDLEQQFDVDCQPMGFNSISLGDYNFDGYEEFSIFQGSNTSRIYFLFNPRTRRFFRSNEIVGTSLLFDSDKKTITESRSCCSGKKQTRILYKILDNKMVQLEEHCFVWDEIKKELVERNMIDCNN